MTSNNQMKYTVRGNLGEKLIVCDDIITIANRFSKRQININNIKRFYIEADEQNNMYISIIFEGVIVWGEQEITFYFPESELDNVKKTTEFVNNCICREIGVIPMTCDKMGQFTLNGQNNTTITVNHNGVTISGKFKDKTILMGDIKKISLVEDGKTLPHLSIMKRTSILKGDSEYDFYYIDNKKKVQEVVNYINSYIT